MRIEAAMRTLGFGGKLEIIRRKEGLTIGQLSDRVGVPEKTLERILCGANSPSAAHLIRILKRLEISLDMVEPEDFIDK